MRALKRATFTVLALLPLAACAGMPLTDPNPSPPRVMPDGRVVQPPPGRSVAPSRFSSRVAGLVRGRSLQIAPSRHPFHDNQAEARVIVFAPRIGRSKLALGARSSIG